MSRKNNVLRFSSSLNFSLNSFFLEFLNFIPLKVQLIVLCDFSSCFLFIIIKVELCGRVHAPASYASGTVHASTLACHWCSPVLNGTQPHHQAMAQGLGTPGVEIRLMTSCSITYPFIKFRETNNQQVSLFQHFGI